MTAHKRMTGWCALIFGASLFVPLDATSIAPVKIDDLYRNSPIVARVHIVAADAEYFSAGVCKTVVERAFKGSKNGDTIFVSPCLSYEIGVSYILFLYPGKSLPEHEDARASPYPSLREVVGVMDAGYGRLLVEYTCVFAGRIPDQSCDYGVKLNPEQVLLPKSLPTFPKSPATAETNYYRWVRQSDIENHLAAIAHPK